VALSAPWRSHRIPFFLYPLVQSQTQSIDVLWRAMVDSRAALKRPTLAVLGSVACHGIGGHRPHAVVMAPPVWLAKATAALTSALSGSRTRDWRRNWGNSSRGEAAFVQVLLLLVLNNFLPISYPHLDLILFMGRWVEQAPRSSWSRISPTCDGHLWTQWHPSPKPGMVTSSLSPQCTKP
jgi:hypothetical protein